LGGTAGATTTEITPVGSGNTTFDVSVSGMTQTGTVVLSVADGAAVDAVGNPSQAPTLVDNTVTFTQVQAVKPTPLTQTVGGNAPVSIDVNYTTEPVNSSLTGLGLRMHFNSSLLVFAALDNVLQNGLIGQQPPVDDVQDFDGDPSTDKYVLVSWADINGQWPGGSLPTRLFTARFTSGSPVEDTTTRVNFTASSAAAGWEFVPTPAEVGIDVTGPSVTVDQAPGQADPTSDSPVVFRVTFSEPVSGFDTSDLTLGGTAGATTTEITPVGSSNTTFEVSVSGMTQSGTVVLSVASGAAVDGAGNPSQAPVNVDNSIQFNRRRCTTGVFTANNTGFHLADVNADGAGQNSFIYGANLRGWLPIAGDWDGDGDDTVGVYDPYSTTFYLVNENSVTPGPVITFSYGGCHPTWLPLAGDWDGDGDDTVGVFVPESATFYLVNENSATPAEVIQFL
jgi:hypothetical protein